MWDKATGLLKTTLSGHYGYVKYVFSDDYKIVSAAADGTIKVDCFLKLIPIIGSPLSAFFFLSHCLLHTRYGTVEGPAVVLSCIQSAHTTEISSTWTSTREWRSAAP